MSLDTRVCPPLVAIATMMAITNNPGIVSRLEDLFEVYYHRDTPSTEKFLVWHQVTGILLDLYFTWNSSHIFYKDAFLCASHFILDNCMQYTSRDADITVYFHFIRVLSQVGGLHVPRFPSLYSGDSYYDDDYEGYYPSQQDRDDDRWEREEREREEWDEWREGGGQGCGECIDVCRCGGT
jgi:hypothetical protein